MPGGREKNDCQMPGGVPGGMVRVGIERDIKVRPYLDRC